jgi:hypothetical protein
VVALTASSLSASVRVEASLTVAERGTDSRIVAGGSAVVVESDSKASMFARWGARAVA